MADLIGALSGVIVLGELLGTIGQFRRGTFVVASVVVGFGSAYWCTRAGNRSYVSPDVVGPSRPKPAARRPGSEVIVASASAALVCSEWSTWVARSISFGIGGEGGGGAGDSLWYHMPFAAAFVQSGWTTRLQYLNGEALVTYYPANTSLLHAVGILAMGSDVLSVFVNLALVPIALLAGWCIGERAGFGPASLAGVAVALTVPTVVLIEASNAKDDVLGIVGLLACIAFVVHSGGRGADRSIDANRRAERACAVFGGLAAGLAIGSKLTLVAPVLALAVGLAILTPARSRLSTMGWWTGAALSTGSYWYVRNLLRVGNPLPGLGIGIGDVRLPRPPTPSMDNFGTDVLRNIGNSRIWHYGLLPGLKLGFGSAWPLIMLVVAAALAVGVATLRGRDLVAPVVGVVALGAFVITPGTVWAPQLISRPVNQAITAGFFSYNLRYMLPAVAIALAIVPLVAHRWHNGTFIATAALGVALAATQLAPQGRQSWAAHHVPVAVGVAAIVGAVVFALTSGRPLIPSLTPRARRVSLYGVAIIVVLVALPVARTYQRDRYRGFDLAGWANTLDSARIGYSGFAQSYPLYGAHLQNHVEMIGVHGPDGSWHPVRTCAAWRRDIRLDRVQFVVVPIGPPSVALGVDLSRWRVGLPGGEPPNEPPESRWTRTDPNAHKVFTSSEGAAVYAVRGPATSKGCT